MTHRIVIIDDDPLFRSLLVELAQAHGHDVAAEAASLAEAEAALRHPADAILLDLHLPDGDGTEVVQRVRAMTTKPIIVLTGADVIDASALQAAGASFTVQKSEIDLDTFRSMLAPIYTTADN